MRNALIIVDANRPANGNGDDDDVANIGEYLLWIIGLYVYDCFGLSRMPMMGYIFGSNVTQSYAVVCLHNLCVIE